MNFTVILGAIEQGLIYGLVAMGIYLSYRTLDIADQAQFLADLEQGLLAGKIVAYAQGFAVLAAASKEHNWNIPLATTARIWREGCIIRSLFLDDIAQAFEGQEIENLLKQPNKRRINGN